eukprot:m.15423 g.15423  ORF g.15423 m.15423 type:complete len:783 (+) comp10462_c0_seq1:26-2374(+)
MAGQEELWKLAAKWLQGLGVLSPDEICLKPDGKVYEFAMALQDGTVLCECANKIVPGSVQHVNASPEKQFMKMQNINQFLEALSNTFKLKDSQIFAADQLYYASNFAKVVDTLSAMSRSPKVAAAGYGAFPATSVANTASEHGQDMYASLEDLVGQSISFQEVRQHRGPVYTEDDGGDDIYTTLQQTLGVAMPEAGGQSDEIYRSLVDVKSSTLTNTDAAGDDDIYGMAGVGPAEKRSRVLEELYETEKNYVGVLENIFNVFKPRLEKSLSNGDVRTIFGNTHELLDAHHAMVKDLEDVMGKTTGRVISTLFNQHMKAFRCYGPFCCNIPDASKRLTELTQKAATNKLLEEARAASKQRFGLKDLLNVPMQRILKYPLLLKELHKQTPDDHPEKQRLPAALKAVEELAKFINDSKKSYEDLKSISRSLNGYNGKPLHSFGRLVKDGDLAFRNTKAREKSKTRYVFLLSTAVLVTKDTRGSRFNHKFNFELTDKMTVEDVPFPADEPSSATHTQAFGLKIKGSADCCYLFAAKNPGTKRKWMAAFQGCLDAITDAKAVIPEVQPRSDSSRALPPVPQPAAAAAPPAGKYEDWSPMAPPSAPTSPASKPGAMADLSDDDQWFAGVMDRSKAVQVMLGMADGTFLVRESVQRPGEYSLSIMYAGECKHIKINRTGSRFDVAPDSKTFSTVQELVHYFQQHSLSRHFPGMDTTLSVPFREPMAANTGIGRARARFPYVARNPDELTFDRGAELIITSTDEADPGWWRGRLATGEEGIFPSNFVQKL